MKKRIVGLRAKFIMALLAVGIIPFMILGAVSHTNTLRALTNQAFNQYKSIRNLKKSQIELFFSDCKRDVEMMARTPGLIDAFKSFKIGFSTGGGFTGGQFRGLKEGRFEAPEIYRDTHRRYFPLFEYHLKQYGYADIFLLDAVQGNIIFTVAKNSDFGQRVTAMDSPLRGAWQAALQGQYSISDTGLYAPAGKIPVQFATAPIREDGVIIGVVALQIPTVHITKIMAERTGMGKLGEVILVGTDGLMRSDAFLDADKRSVKASLAHPEEGRMDIEPVRAALSGQTGEMISTDHNGNTVFSAYAPLSMGETTWAVIAYVHESEALAPVKKLQKTMGLIALGGIVLIVVFAFFFAGSITRPVEMGTRFAEQMVRGDFTQTLNIHRRDEIGVLADSLNGMIKGLRSLIRELAQGSETLSSASTQLSAISGQLSAGAEETSARSNTVATAAEEMSANMNSVAAATEEASTNMNMVAAASEQMTATISEIAESAEKARHITHTAVTEAREASDTVDQLGHAAREIGKVTESITEISEQTNLLALNATIEAARAGDAGRGFAVVANEIKELAKQASKASDEIKRRIHGIQESTEGTVSQIGRITAVINQVNEIVSTIAAAVEEQSVTTREIAGNVTHAAQGMAEVTENVAQSSTVAGEIARDIAQVNQSAEEISASSSQVSLSAEDLNKLAERLKIRVDQCKV